MVTLDFAGDDEAQIVEYSSGAQLGPPSSAGDAEVAIFEHTVVRGPPALWMANRPRESEAAVGGEISIGRGKLWPLFRPPRGGETLAIFRR